MADVEELARRAGIVPRIPLEEIARLLSRAFSRTPKRDAEWRGLGAAGLRQAERIERAVRHLLDALPGGKVPVLGFVAVDYDEPPPVPLTAEEQAGTMTANGVSVPLSDDFAAMLSRDKAEPERQARREAAAAAWEQQLVRSLDRLGEAARMVIELEASDNDFRARWRDRHARRNLVGGTLVAIYDHAFRKPRPHSRQASAGSGIAGRDAFIALALETAGEESATPDAIKRHRTNYLAAWKAGRVSRRVGGPPYDPDAAAWFPSDLSGAPAP